MIARFAPAMQARMSGSGPGVIPLTSLRPMPVLPRSKDYDTLYRQFRWRCRRATISASTSATAGPKTSRIASRSCTFAPTAARTITYGWLRDTSNRLANVLRAHGIARGDRVAILLPQSPEVAAAHIAIYKLGGVALPLAVLFGTDALAYRLQNSGATALITNAPGARQLAEIRNDLPELKLVLSLDGAGDGASASPTRSRARRPISRRSTHRPTIRP